jgi:deferrochelatase/peroxidase EfeB
VSEILDEDDIQGLLRRPYKDLKSARFLLVKVNQPAPARAYLRRLCADEKITPARRSPKDFAMHVAFTRSGLDALEVPQRAIATFPREFKEGMHDADRAVVLGDVGENRPDDWEFGNGKGQRIDLMLLLYAIDDNELSARVELEKRALRDAGMELFERETRWLEPDKEHFGFRDGISRVAAAGFDDGRPDPDGNRRHFKSGEFILGYQNEYGHYTESPVVVDGDDPDRLLPRTRDGAARDLGLNGSYLVYRQLHQRVSDFWRWVAGASKEPSESRADAAIRLASKMVGRWPEGASLVDSLSPAASDKNTFGFYDVDRHGVRCPLGSHIRRTNPRDHLPVDHTKADSIEMVGKHQIMRRGRTYGRPLVPDLHIPKMIETPDDGAPRGLHFICLVGHIHRQFEFIQNAWVKSPVFGGLTAENDPLIGARGDLITPKADEFTCPADPVRRKYRGMPQLTKLLGGGYFFLPGLRALRYIASDRVGR